MLNITSRLFGDLLGRKNSKIKETKSAQIADTLSSIEKKSNQVSLSDKILEYSNSNNIPVPFICMILYLKGVINDIRELNFGFGFDDYYSIYIDTQELLKYYSESNHDNFYIKLHNLQNNILTNLKISPTSIQNYKILFDIINNPTDIIFVYNNFLTNVGTLENLIFGFNNFLRVVNGELSENMLIQNLHNNFLSKIFQMLNNIDESSDNFSLMCELIKLNIDGKQTKDYLSFIKDYIKSIQKFSVNDDYIKKAYAFASTYPTLFKSFIFLPKLKNYGLSSLIDLDDFAAFIGLIVHINELDYHDYINQGKPAPNYVYTGYLDRVTANLIDSVTDPFTNPEILNILSLDDLLLLFRLNYFKNAKNLLFFERIVVVCINSGNYEVLLDLYNEILNSELYKKKNDLINSLVFLLNKVDLDNRPFGCLVILFLLDKDVNNKVKLFSKMLNIIPSDTGSYSKIISFYLILKSHKNLSDKSKDRLKSISVHIESIKSKFNVENIINNPKLFEDASISKYIIQTYLNKEQIQIDEFYSMYLISHTPNLKYLFIYLFKHIIKF